jgi:hypothetical protein
MSSAYPPKSENRQSRVPTTGHPAAHDEMRWILVGAAVIAALALSLWLDVF